MLFRSAASAEVFTASLSGAQEVSPVTTSGTGSATVVISADRSTITYLVTYSGLSGAAVAAHIHTAAAGANGPIILPFPSPASPISGSFTATDLTPAGGVTTFAQAIAAIEGGTTYVNIHTAAHPGGEIRGQLGLAGAGPVATPTPAPTVAPTAVATEPPVATAPTTSTVPQGQTPSGTPILAAIVVMMAVAGFVLTGRRFSERRAR